MNSIQRHESMMQTLTQTSTCPITMYKSIGGGVSKNCQGYLKDKDVIENYRPISIVSTISIFVWKSRIRTIVFSFRTQ